MAEVVAAEGRDDEDDEGESERDVRRDAARVESLRRGVVRRVLRPATATRNGGRLLWTGRNEQHEVCSFLVFLRVDHQGRLARAQTALSAEVQTVVGSLQKQIVLAQVFA